MLADLPLLVLFLLAGSSLAMQTQGLLDAQTVDLGMKKANLACADRNNREVRRWIDRPGFLESITEAQRATLLSTLIHTITLNPTEGQISLLNEMIKVHGFGSVEGHDDNLIRTALEAGNLDMFQFILSLNGVNLDDAIGPALVAAAHKKNYEVIEKVFELHTVEEDPLEFTVDFDSIRNLFIASAYHQELDTFWQLADLVRNEEWIQDFQLLQVINDAMEACSDESQLAVFLQLFLIDYDDVYAQYFEFSQQLPVIHPMFCLLESITVLKSLIWLPEESWQAIRDVAVTDFTLMTLQQNEERPSKFEPEIAVAGAPQEAGALAEVSGDPSVKSEVELYPESEDSKDSDWDQAPQPFR